MQPLRSHPSSERPQGIETVSRTVPVLHDSLPHRALVRVDRTGRCFFCPAVRFWRTEAESDGIRPWLTRVLVYALAVARADRLLTTAPSPSPLTSFRPGSGRVALGGLTDSFSSIPYPSPVACSQAVLLVKGHVALGRPAFVNGVVSQHGPPMVTDPLPDVEIEPVDHLSVVHSHPRGWWSAGTLRWVFDRASAVCEIRSAGVGHRANQLIRPPCMRWRIGLEGRRRGQTRQHFFRPALRLSGRGLRRAPARVWGGGFSRYKMKVRSWWHGRRSDPRHRIIDLCAGPGGRARTSPSRRPERRQEGCCSVPPS